MNLPELFRDIVRHSARLALLAAPLLLGTRVYVAWQFLKSGWLKLSSWDTTLFLFTDEYHVPLLPPHVAAVAGTFGELFFPVLVALGLFGRLGALGLFAVNAMAVVSYADVLLAEGSEAALGQHVLWGYMLAVIAIMGPGRLALDELLGRPLPAAGRLAGSRAA
jgi:putative oxidoreductase